MAVSLYTAGMNPNDRDLQRKTNRKHGRHAGERLAGNLRDCIPKLVGDLLINHVISATVAFPFT